MPDRFQICHYIIAKQADRARLGVRSSRIVSEQLENEFALTAKSARNCARKTAQNQTLKK